MCVCVCVCVCVRERERERERITEHTLFHKGSGLVSGWSLYIQPSPMTD